MILDYFNKSLQGGLLKKLRNYIMGQTRMPKDEHIGNNYDTEKYSMTIGQMLKNNR